MALKLKPILLKIWSLFVWIGKLLRRITDVKLHRVANAGILLIHLLAVVEFLLHPLEDITGQGIVGIGFIGFVFSYWTIVAHSLFKQEKRKLLENNKIQGREILDLKSAIADLQIHCNYSNAYGEFAEAYCQIHDLQRFISAGASQPNPDMLARSVFYLERFCDQVSYAFSRIADDEISTCIKVITGDPNKDTTETSTIRTMVRNQKNSNQRSVDVDTSHIVRENTAYKHVIKNVNKPDHERAFFSNNLPLLPNYQNSSFNLYGQEIFNDSQNEEYRMSHWRLPYKSTIVGAICPNVPAFKKSRFIIGFICVDSKKIGMFREDKDIQIINSLGDGLYNVLKQFQILKLSKNSKHEKKIGN